MTKMLHGKVRGKTIELEEDPGVSDGQEVEVHINIVPTKERWGEGLRRCAGALANDWTKEDDRILEQIHEDRTRETRTELAE